MTASWTSAFGRACGVLLDTIVRWLALSRLNPNVLTFMGLVANTWAAILFGSANGNNQKRMFIYAGLVIIFSGFFDLVDGQVARATNRVTRFGAFFDSVVDRYSDASQFLGLLVFYARGGRVFEGGEHHPEKTPATGVENQQAEELAGVAVAVDDRIEERSEAGDAVGGAGDLSVDQVEEAGEDDDQAGVEEHALLVVGVGGGEQDGGPGVDQQSHEGEDVGIDAREREPADDGVEQDSAGAAEGAGPTRCHYAPAFVGSSAISSWIVLNFRISSSRLPLGESTMTSSPTFLFNNARPMGEVVEIFPVATSDSSLVTSLYCISSFLVLSKTLTVDPRPTRSWGMLFMLTMDR